MVSQTRPSGQIFALSQTVGYVEGQVLKYTVNADGSFSAAAEPLDALTTQELESLASSLLPASMPIPKPSAE